MSVRYSITGEHDGCEWPVTSACVEGASGLSKVGFERQLAAVCLDANAELGEQCILHKADALSALKKLMPASRRVPKGFQVRTEFWGDPENKEFQAQIRAQLRALGEQEDAVGRAISGLRIDGVCYWISCEEDYWRIQPMTNPPPPEGKVAPQGMRGEPRREPEEIHTENFGIVKVEVQKGRSDIEILLSHIKRFLSSSPDTSFRVVVG